MAVFQNIATSDVIIIVLQLGKVQSWLALKRKEKDYTFWCHFNEKPSFTPGFPHAWLALHNHAWKDDDEPHAHSIRTEEAHIARHDTLLLL